MPRVLTDGDDRWERLERDDERADWYRLRRLEADRYGPAQPATHCAICGKPLEARLTCVACGDETDVERTGDGASEIINGTRGIRQDRGAASGPSAERPDEERAA